MHLGALSPVTQNASSGGPYDSLRTITLSGSCRTGTTILHWANISAIHYCMAQRADPEGWWLWAMSEKHTRGSSVHWGCVQPKPWNGQLVDLCNCRKICLWIPQRVCTRLVKVSLTGGGGILSSCTWSLGCICIEVLQGSNRQHILG